ncbi:hypothetical protein DQ244_09485 [Blastococcus sp. TBT05-19]|uniref:hypothetical protein n=1 Tax=Blastococcus sp. TBT05-19 TaxID=2250581 RepID=UPI000DE9C5B4|nr:hypothetical protein [Blastococcus sp. TBT05-19]RBY91548.1 hypothetical protein DQ244_09485 [Blastococcus sp. TBT05-19]
MGRHTAADGAGAHPLVAAALAQRAGDGGGTHHGGTASAPEESGLGWPVTPDAPEPGDGGLGWPGGGPEQGAEDAVPADAAGTRARRGWRRLFGARAA